MSARYITAAVFTLTMLGSTLANAAPTMREVLTATYRVRDLSAVELTPDGKAVAWQESFHDPGHLLRSARYNALYIQSLDDGARVQLTAGTVGGFYDEDESGLVAGRPIDRVSLRRAIERASCRCSLPRPTGRTCAKSGRLRGDVQRLTWSPNAETAALLYIPAAHREAGALAPGARDVGVIGSHCRRAAACDDRRRRPERCTC